MLFISDVQYYVPKKLCKTAGSIHLFKITGTLKSGECNIKTKLHLGCYRNRLEGDQCDFRWQQNKLTKVCQDKI